MTDRTSSITRQAAVVFIFLAGIMSPITADAEEGMLLSVNQGQAQLLALDDVSVGPGGLLVLRQGDSSVEATVKAVDQVGLELEFRTAAGDIQPGLVELSVRYAGRDPYQLEEGQAGSLDEPLFTLDTKSPEDNVQDAGTAADTGGSGGGGAGPGGTGLAGILAFVREWISVAEPPQNAKPGYRLRYSQWGQFSGSTPTGNITINAKPDDAAGLPYDQFLWTRRPTLPSLNHCVLRDYVERRMAGEDIAACRTARSGMDDGGDRGDYDFGQDRGIFDPERAVAGGGASDSILPSSLPGANPEQQNTAQEGNSIGGSYTDDPIANAQRGRERAEDGETVADASSPRGGRISDSWSGGMDRFGRGPDLDGLPTREDGPQDRIRGQRPERPDKPPPKPEPKPSPKPEPKPPPKPEPKPPPKPEPKPPPKPEQKPPPKPEQKPPPKPSVQFGGKWTGKKSCGGYGDSAYRWVIALQQTGNKVTGHIHFHKCPGGGRASYEVIGTATSKKSVELKPTLTSSRGPLADTLRKKPVRTFRITNGRPPSPNLAP